LESRPAGFVSLAQNGPKITPPWTYDQQRRDIQHDIDEFFSRMIHITPRAMAEMQAGETVDRGEHGERLGRISALRHGFAP
jgi:hypothetical protein